MRQGADPQSTAAQRWMGVGRSDDPDSRAATLAAARGALVGDQPKLLIAFTAITHDPVAVLDGLQAIAPGVPIVGCSTHGEIAPGGPRDGTVTVAAIGGSGFAVATTAAEEVFGRQRMAGAEVAACADQIGEKPYRVLLLLTDGMIRDQEEIVRGCYSVLGQTVPLFGGGAADGWRMSGVYLFGNGKVLSDAIVAAAIGSDAPLSVSISHGWRPVGEPMIVTSSGNGRVYTLDDRPALDVYLDRIGAPPEAYTDANAFSAFTMTRPLGIQRGGAVEIRNVSTEVDLLGRSIGGGGVIDHGSLTWVMTGDEESILRATDTACEAALNGLGERPPVGMLTLSCAALRQVVDPAGLRSRCGRVCVAAIGVRRCRRSWPMAAHARRVRPSRRRRGAVVGCEESRAVGLAQGAVAGRTHRGLVNGWAGTIKWWASRLRSGGPTSRGWRGIDAHRTWVRS
jgi:hypothetical protein